MQRDRYEDISALVDHEPLHGTLGDITTEDREAYRKMQKISNTIDDLVVPNPVDPEVVISSVWDRIDRNPFKKILGKIVYIFVHPC